MDWLTALTPYFEHGTYFAMFLVLVLCGVGLPVPEEITFITAGIVAREAGANVWVMAGAGLLGILAGDSLTYLVGRRYGMNMLARWPFSRFLKKDSIEKARDFIDRHGSHAVFAAGFLAGVRAPTYFLCGSMGLSYARFIFWDLARAVLTCPISVWLAWRFGEEAKQMLSEYSYVFAGIVVMAILFMLYRHLRLKRKARSLARTVAVAEQPASPAKQKIDPAPKEKTQA